MLIALASLSLLAAADANCGPGHPVLVENWRAEGFGNPESLLPDGEGGFFISNVAGEAAERNGEGHISRSWGDGTIRDARWVEGLNAPKGLTISEGRLFVTDIDDLVEIEIWSGEILARHSVDGAGFLNDAAALPDGRILFTDSANARIYVYDGTSISVWMEDERLGGVNGLWPETDRLVVTTMAEGYVLAIDWDDLSTQILAEGLTNADGIARWCEGYLISQWPGVISYLHDDGRVQSLLDQREAGILMNDFVIHDGKLMIPNWNPGTIWAFDLQRMQY